MTGQILVLLIAERDKLDRAIDALQGPVTAKRRGRPPKNSLAVTFGSTTEVAASTPAKPKAKKNGKKAEASA